MSHSLGDNPKLNDTDHDPDSLLAQSYSTSYNDRSPNPFPETSSPVPSSAQPPLDLHQFESTHLQVSQLNGMTDNQPRPKQKMVAPKKKGSTKKKGGQIGRSEGNGARSRATKSATPAPAQPTRIVVLKYKKGETLELPETSAPQEEPIEVEDEPIHEDELQMHNEPVHRSRRSGRQIKKQQKDIDYVMGSEMDQAIEVSSVSKAEDDGSYGPEFGSSPPYNGTSNFQIFQLQPAPVPKHPRKAKNARSSLPTIEEEPSSNTIAPQTPHPVQHSGDLMSNVPTAIRNIFDDLRGKSTVLVDLPSLSHAENPEEEMPYSAKMLVQLYLTCYHSKVWNLCDLIADTWIRAFHSLRRQGEYRPEAQIWRPNKILDRRQKEENKKVKELADAKRELSSKKKGPTKEAIDEDTTIRAEAVGFDEDAPDYELDVVDPDLEDNVTSFHSTLLSELYNMTDEKCGARLLWADAMTLCGNTIEDVLAKSLRNGDKWHQDLFVNIMFSSLRMVRRKLTLKIEEACEGAWCKRYHEHSKHGMPCYRELAWKEKEERLAREDAARTLAENGEEEDVEMETPGANEQSMNYVGGGHMNLEWEEYGLEAQMMAELSRGEKRGAEEVDGLESRAPKRVHFNADVDAEGESDED